MQLATLQALLTPGVTANAKAMMMVVRRNLGLQGAVIAGALGEPPTRLVSNKRTS